MGCSCNKILDLCFLLLSIVILQAIVVAAGAPKVPCFFIFGDSLVDNGNNIYRNVTVKVNHLPYGVDFAAGSTGRFTNGRNTIDFIAEMLGFDNYIPRFHNATSEEILGGLNYGSGGAGILDETSRELYGDVISLNEQLSIHEGVISRIAKVLGSKSAAKKQLKSCLYSVGMGNNDYLANYLPKYYASTAPYTPKQFAALLIAKHTTQLIRLYYNGARKIAVFAPGKLGCVPQQMVMYGTSSDDSYACVETSNEIVQIFRDNLKLLVGTLNTLLPGAKFVFTDTSKATSLGNITNLSDPCCPVSTDAVSGGHCVEGGVPCSNRDEYLFFDWFHPTEAANKISAQIAYNDISTLLIAGDGPNIAVM